MTYHIYPNTLTKRFS